MTIHVTPPSLTALRTRFSELFGNPPPPRMRAAILAAAIAWKEQVLAHGDIAPALARDLAIIARECSERRVGRATSLPEVEHRPDAKPAKASSPRRASAKTEPPAPLPPASARLRPGARLVRAYGGVTHIVEVTADGFVHAGRTYGSLSAVAKAITGTHWNGLLFFGLRRRKTPGGSTSKRRRQETATVCEAAHG